MGDGVDHVFANANFSKDEMPSKVPLLNSIACKNHMGEAGQIGSKRWINNAHNPMLYTYPKPLIGMKIIVLKSALLMG